VASRARELVGESALHALLSEPDAPYCGREMGWMAPRDPGEIAGGRVRGGTNAWGATQFNYRAGMPLSPMYRWPACMGLELCPGPKMALPDVAALGRALGQRGEGTAMTAPLGPLRCNFAGFDRQPCFDQTFSRCAHGFAVGLCLHEVAVLRACGSIRQAAHALAIPTPWMQATALSR
jgi:hypothetical protein